MPIRPINLEKLYKEGHDFLDLDDSLSLGYVHDLFQFMSQIDFQNKNSDTRGLYGPSGSPEGVPRCVPYDDFETAPVPVKAFWGYIHDSPLLVHFRRRGSFKMETSLVRYFKGQGLAPHNDLQGSPAELNLALCLNHNWTKEDGGIIRFTKKGVLLGEVDPVFGRLIVILNNPPFFFHEVTEVKTERLSALCRMIAK